MYENSHGVKVAFAALADIEPAQVFFTDAPFDLSPPPGEDWADYEEQEDGPPIRTPRPAWDWYRQQYPHVANVPPTPEAVAAWAPPVITPEEPAPVTDVEIMTPVFIDYRRQATLHLDGLKAQVWSYLKNDQSMDPAAATAAGVAFCKSGTGIGVQYEDYIKAGGHPDAAADLWARIQEIKGNFAWFDAGVEAIFAAALGQEL